MSNGGGGGGGGTEETYRETDDRSFSRVKSFCDSEHTLKHTFAAYSLDE